MSRKGDWLRAKRARERASKANQSESASEEKSELVSDLMNVKPDIDYQQRVEARHEIRIKAIEKDEGFPITEELLQQTESATQDLMTSDETHIGVRFSFDNLNAILDSGRFKSQFEVTHSEGDYNPSYRAEIEFNEMGYSKTIPVEKRPIYGMLFSYRKPSQVNVSYGAGDQYGNVVAIMKSSIKARTTITGSDSLDRHGYVIPSPMLRPSRYMYESKGLEDGVLRYAIRNVRAGRPVTLRMFERISSYVEAQMHGGVSVKDIQHLIFATPPDKMQATKLSKLGITWSLEGEDTIH